MADSSGTGRPTRITDSIAFDVEPSVDYYGNIVVFTSNRDSDFEIFVQRLSCILGGDVNGDGLVNIVDLVRIGSAFGKSLGQLGYDPEADLNHDGTVNIVDLVLVGTNYGKTC